MKHFGIIGLPLDHSFSAKLFTKKFENERIDAEYSLYPLESIEDLPKLINNVELSGLNVTMPYKQTVIPYLDELDEAAAEIGAVNVIAFRQGKYIGYNTDVIGFVNSLRPLLAEDDRRALVLGTGGASRAVCYGLRQMGIEAIPVSRNQERGLSYGQLTPDIMKRCSIIINTTPLGMTPLSDSLPPIPYGQLTPKHLLFDLIYNPQETLFLREGRERGCRTKNGLDMLTGQAEAAWHIWESENR